MDYISYFNSPLGRITMLSDGEVLTGLWFEGQDHCNYPAASEVGEAFLPIFIDTARWLGDYFGGNVPDFTPPYKLTGTPFQLSVWEIVSRIPYGCTVTYGEIASEIAEKRGIGKMSAQAVGAAVGRNPISIIVPCHRVIGADGRLVGYVGGIKRKAGLLELEKIPFKV